MTIYKRVKIIVPEVHDGLGGIHKVNDRPVFESALADLFIEKKVAVLDGTISQAEAKKLASESEDAQRQTDQKIRAAAVMQRHDALPAEDRLEDAFPDPVDEPGTVARKPKTRKAPDETAT